MAHVNDCILNSVSAWALSSLSSLLLLFSNRMQKFSLCSHFPSVHLHISSFLGIIGHGESTPLGKSTDYTLSDLRLLKFYLLHSSYADSRQ